MRPDTTAMTCAIVRGETPMESNKTLMTCSIVKENLYRYGIFVCIDAGFDAGSGRAGILPDMNKGV